MKKLFAGIVGLSLVLTVLAGCIAGPRDEKQAFVDATIEATCYIFEAENIFDPAVEEEAKAIYAKYGFDVEDEEAMEAIALKFAEEEDVQTEILAGIEECTPESLNLGEQMEEEMEDDGEELEDDGEELEDDGEELEDDGEEEGEE